MVDKQDALLLTFVKYFTKGGGAIPYGTPQLQSAPSVLFSFVFNMRRCGLKAPPMTKLSLYGQLSDRRLSIYLHPYL